MISSRHILLTVLFALDSVAAASGQTADSGAKPFWPQRTAMELAVAPSPEVGTLPGWQGPDVDLSTGQGTLSFPLIEWSVGSYAMKIGLNYRIGAFRTDELPGWVGLGWNLTGLGSVSRTVVGQPDEKLPFELRTAANINSSSDGVDYLTRLETLKTEASRDRYRYSLPSGQSGAFVIRNGLITQLPRSDNRIELIGTEQEKVRDFRITTPDGIRYEFTEREHSEYTYTPAILDNLFKSPNYRAVTTWHLSRIITPEGADTIRIEYRQASPLIRDHQTSPYIISMRQDQVSGCNWLSSPMPGHEGIYVNSTIFPDQKILYRIVSRTAVAEASYFEVSGKTAYISSLTLRSPDGNNVRTAELSRYPNTPSLLTSYSVRSSDGAMIDGCEFTYHGRNTHRIGDIFNYPNCGASVSYALTSVIDYDTGKLNPRRRPDFSYAVAGALKQTISASGILTNYTYEPNSIPFKRDSPRRANTGNLRPVDSLVKPPIPFDPIEPPDEDPDTSLIIGIRLKKITSTDISTGRKTQREFNYSDGMCNIDFRKVGMSEFSCLSGLQWFRSVSTMAIARVYDTSVALLTGSRSPGMHLENASIYYGKVTETVSGTGIESPLCTIYRFDLSRCRLALVSGGRDMKPVMSNLQQECRSLLTAFYPTYGPEIYRTYFTSQSVRCYWREHIGATPELSEMTRCRWTGTGYEPEETQRRFYSTYDTVCIAANLHYEPLVRRVKNFTTGALSRDYQSVNDLSHIEIDIEATSRRLDSLSVIRHYPDGSQTVRNVAYSYSGIKDISISHPGGIGIPLPGDHIQLPDTIVLLPITGDPVWGGDSINYLDAPRLPIKETVTEGGHRMVRHTLYSSMIKSGFHKEAAGRGLRTLPVAEMWVMDGCDTLVRHHEYGRFAGAGGTLLTRPTAISTAVNGVTIDLQRVTGGYSPHGLPLSVSQTGRPETAFSWGYGGDLLTSLTLLPPEITPEKASHDVEGNSITIPEQPLQLAYGLRSTFEHAPLVGCTKAVSPSGRTASYAYSGGRLSEVRDSRGQLTASHSYELHGDTPGTYAGNNRISSTIYLDGGSAGSTVSRWYDGFGLLTAEVTEAAGGDGSDVATFTYRDAIGRPLSQWLPLTVSITDVPDILKRESRLTSIAMSTHGDSEAVARMSYGGDVSELPRTSTIGGTAYAAHPATAEQTCSNPSDALRRVVRWCWDGTTLSAAGHYGAGELKAVKTADGDGRTAIVFTDCLGSTVLSRQITDDGSYADTYTVSDRWGNPMIVIPPEMSRQLGESSLPDKAKISELIDIYAYVYRYDRQQRLRSKKLPGCDPISYAYDSEGRLAFTRDGNQARQGRRSFVLYDGYGREAITGTCRDALDESFWTGDPSYDSGVIRPDYTATCLLSPSAAIGDSTTFLSTGYVIPDELKENLSEAGLLTATYYDSYSFIPAARRSGIMQHQPPTACVSPRGLVTGSLAATLGNDSECQLLTVTFYDIEERPVATVSDTHTGAAAVTETSYTIGGLPLTVSTSIIGGTTDTGGIAASSTLTYSYDSQGRATDTYFRYGNAARQRLSGNSYDRLGQLQQVIVCGKFSRTIDHDMHGWQTKWATPYIEQQLFYADGAEPSYSGRISSKVTTAYGTDRRYDYSYDRLGRLTAARFSGRDPNSGIVSQADFSATYSYDLQGNILSLKRNGLVDPDAFGEIDDIAATFRGNQIVSLREDAEDVLLESSLDVRNGIWDGEDFRYDANGNQTRDMSRGVADVTYNVLNLPQTVTMEDGSCISYVYMATGAKLAETVKAADGDTIVRRDYVGNLELTTDAGDARPDIRLLLPEGYLTLADTVYHAYIPDYQGNIVGVYDSGANRLEQYTDYYPYGLPHATSVSPTTNRRKFGGKELATDLGLNLHDFAARWQNPALGRFTTPDPLLEKYRDISPYSFCAGDPINHIDPTGKEVILYATNLPGGNFWLRMATHTFIAVKDANGFTIARFSYGPQYDGIPSGIGLGGALTKYPTLQDKQVADGIDTEHLKMAITIEPPEGMTQEQFDKNVIEVANSFGDDPGINYALCPKEEYEGNCNSSSATILIKSGVSKETIKQIKKQLPGISWGFEPEAKPWTFEEQQKAVERKPSDEDVINNLIKNRKFLTK